MSIENYLANDLGTDVANKALLVAQLRDENEQLRSSVKLLTDELAKLKGGDGDGDNSTGPSGKSSARK
ncbi:hypothetical protein [Lacticaseibacillus saniviri]|uniref:hypothetical protein n=1 Tax=Lacticaseibacillus saniviri TaxID=931533 RepID=UPI000B045C84|nr:hypothetical protein [Lacticaseibacillus saniviri]